jgi:ABC-type Fe3+-siderophore transport system permease subunit
VHSAFAGRAHCCAGAVFGRRAHRARPAELPLGAVTALVGVPFFLVRLRRAA